MTIEAAGFGHACGSRHPGSFPMISDLINKRKLFSAPSNNLKSTEKCSRAKRIDENHQKHS